MELAILDNKTMLMLYSFWVVLSIAIHKKYEMIFHVTFYTLAETLS